MKDRVKAAAITNYRPIGEILMLKTVPLLLCIPVLGFQRISSGPLNVPNCQRIRETLLVRATPVTVC
jgi:hypothetical protein